MFSQDLKDKCPFLTEYFQQGLNKTEKALAHSILFYGQDVEVQYELASEIARLLNCNESKDENCTCLNCTWAREHKHPAIMTISRIDNKPSDDDSKTVISIKQAQMVKNSLMNTSDYHRVFIFCDATIEKIGDNQVWMPAWLNQTNFQEESANSLLKIIEEPPPNTTFFFLTRDRNDLLETIISRSQSFFVPSYNSEKRSFASVEDVFSDYLELERQQSFDFAQNIFVLSKELGFKKVLTEIQNYLLELVKSNLDNTIVKNKILADIKAVELAQKMIEKKVNPQSALEDMCLSFTK